MVVGDRSAKTCRKLWERLPEPYPELSTSTDFYAAYLAVVADEQHRPSKKGSGLTRAVARFNLSLRQCASAPVRQRASAPAGGEDGGQDALVF